MSIDGEPTEESPPDGELDSWRIYFSQQFSILFNRVGKIRNYKVQAEIFENLTPVQQKGRRVGSHCKRNWKNVRINILCRQS